MNRIEKGVETIKILKFKRGSVEGITKLHIVLERGSIQLIDRPTGLTVRKAAACSWPSWAAAAGPAHGSPGFLFIYSFSIFFYNF